MANSVSLAEVSLSLVKRRPRAAAARLVKRRLGSMDSLGSAYRDKDQQFGSPSVSDRRGEAANTEAISQLEAVVKVSTEVWEQSTGTRSRTKRRWRSSETRRRAMTEDYDWTRPYRAWEATLKKQDDEEDAAAATKRREAAAAAAACGGCRNLDRTEERRVAQPAGETLTQAQLAVEGASACFMKVDSSARYNGTRRHWWPTTTRFPKMARRQAYWIHAARRPGALASTSKRSCFGRPSGAAEKLMTMTRRAF